MTLDWHLVLGIVAGILPLVPIIPYVKDTLSGSTRPNIFSFAIWDALLAISIWAQIISGASWSVFLLAGDFIGTGSVVVLCLFGYGYGKYGRLEWICTGLAVAAIVLWQLTSQPMVAIVFAVLADALAAVPTIVKTYREPSTESPLLWLVIALGAALALSSSTIFDVANLLFPTYLLIVNGLIGVLALRGRKGRAKHI